MTLRHPALAGPVSIALIVMGALSPSLAGAREHGHHHRSHHGKKGKAPAADQAPAGGAAPDATPVGDAAAGGESVPDVIRPATAPVDPEAAEAFQSGVAEILAGHLKEAIPLLLRASKATKPEPKI